MTLNSFNKALLTAASIFTFTIAFLFAYAYFFTSPYSAEIPISVKNNTGEDLKFSLHAIDTFPNEEVSYIKYELKFSEEGQEWWGLHPEYENKVKKTKFILEAAKDDDVVFTYTFSKKFYKTTVIHIYKNPYKAEEISKW